jgi:transposase-like protein
MAPRIITIRKEKGYEEKMNEYKKKGTERPSVEMPDLESIQEELSKVESMDDFFGREGIFAKLFAGTLEKMLEAELSGHLGYERYEAEGRNSGNNRNGSYGKKVRTSSGDVEIQVPRDRNGTYEPRIVPKYGNTTNELEEKILGLYAKGVSTRDIQDTLAELYGVDISPGTISKVTDKVWELVEEWQNRPLEAVYPIIYLDAIHLKLRRDGKVCNTAVHIVLGVNLKGYRDILGHWVADGSEGANFWLSVLSDLQNRGVQEIFIASVDGLTGFSEAIRAVFPEAEIQRCLIHQIRSSLRYVAWKDRKEFVHDLKTVYQAPNREAAEANLLRLGEKWNDKYAVAVRSWENHWDELATFFDYPAEIRRLIYTTNTIEGYNRQLRKVIKNKSSFSTTQAVRKLLYLANVDILKKWTRPIPSWPLILNQLAIRFPGRCPL